MKARLVLCSTLLALAAGPLHADDAAKAKSTAVAADKAKPAAQAAMDSKVMEDLMMKSAAPGPQHERLKKLEGEWEMVVTATYDPTQPPQESKAVSMIHSLMDGRYSEERATGESMGRPFSGMGITGYDNVIKKYVSIWIDNMGTGIMTSQGTADASGNVINWNAEGSDPMTGKTAKYRMVTRFTDDDNYSFEMFGKGMDGKEMKMMVIRYTRKKV